MTPTRLHIVNAILFWVVVLSGVLLLPAPFSSLREWILGGHGIELRKAHTWGSVPLFLSSAMVYRRYVTPTLLRRRTTSVGIWKQGNTVLSLSFLSILVGTGLYLWVRPGATRLEWIRDTHVLATWTVIPWILIHACVETVRYLHRKRVTVRQSLKPYEVQTFEEVQSS